MNHTTVINKISELGYKGFKEAYLRQMEDVNYHNLSFQDRLYQLLDAQDTFLNNRRTQMNLKLSKIKDKNALIENIDYVDFAIETEGNLEQDSTKFDRASIQENGIDNLFGYSKDLETFDNFLYEKVYKSADA